METCQHHHPCEVKILYLLGSLSKNKLPFTGPDFAHCSNLVGGPVSFILPNIKKLDNGLTRRIKVINYPFMFVDNPTLSHHRQIDRTLRDKFNNVEFYREFLLLCIEVYLETINNNNSITIPKSIQENSNQYFDDNNPVKTFIDTHIRQVEPELKQKIKTTDLKAEFDNVFPDRKMHIRAFIQAMAFNGYDVSIKDGYKYFKNIEIINGNNDINIELEF